MSGYERSPAQPQGLVHFPANQFGNITPFAAENMDLNPSPEVGKIIAQEKTSKLAPRQSKQARA